MKYGLHLPNVEPLTLAELAYEGEIAGWDGLFVWDGIWGIDAWVSLTVVAMRTERIRFGTLITPLSRRRPWKVASEAVTLDHISKGRFILPVGLGAPDTGFDKVGEETDRKIRAQLLDESLEIITRLWSGQHFDYDGQHYQLRDMHFSPTPVQSPRIPIWVVGAWPRPKSMQRVIRYDGILTDIMLMNAGLKRPPLILCFRAKLRAMILIKPPKSCVPGLRLARPGGWRLSGISR
jgi:alkanesulfonate monooxygenase SsuD/methylene tetrahydromethanopterin reductase-like flavin-dependent oxidoreductase (luciferase family)